MTNLNLHTECLPVKKRLTSIAIFFGLLTISAFCDETNIFARMGTPTNELAAIGEPVVQSLNSEDLAESLGIKHWNFLVQIPDNWVGFTMSFNWIENGTKRELGHSSFPIDRFDHETGKHISGPYQDRVLLVVSPADSSTEDPWRNSAKLRVFIKDYEQGVSGFDFIENPFRKKNLVFVTYGSPSMVRDKQKKLGTSEALATEFKLLASGTNEFRVSFQLGYQMTIR